MPLDCNEIVEVATQLSQNAKLRVSATQSLKGGLKAGGGAAVGALIGGPLGMLAGGVIGSLYAYSTSSDFKGVPQVISEMSVKERDALAKSLERILSGIDASDVHTVMVLLASDSLMRDRCLAVIRRFIEDQCKMEILD